MNENNELIPQELRRFTGMITEMAEAHSLPVSQMANLVYNERGKLTLRSIGVLTLAVRSPSYGGHFSGIRHRGGDDPDNQAEPMAEGDMCAWVVMWRKGTEKEDRTVTKFSLEDARDAGLAGRHSWKAYPKDMLMARAIVRAVKAVLPDALMGLDSEDEMAPLSSQRNDAPSHSDLASAQSAPIRDPEVYSEDRDLSKMVETTERRNSR